MRRSIDRMEDERWRRPTSRSGRQQAEHDDDEPPYDVKTIRIEYYLGPFIKSLHQVCVRDIDYSQLWSGELSHRLQLVIIHICRNCPAMAIKYNIIIMIF